MDPAPERDSFVRPYLGLEQVQPQDRDLCPFVPNGRVPPAGEGRSSLLLVAERNCCFAWKAPGRSAAGEFAFPVSWPP